MKIEEILAGESKSVEFKEALPDKNIKYMKTVIAFANGHGGKLVFGVKDGSNEVVGIDKETVFKMMDAITNAISDCCEPMIIPDISLQEVEGKTIIVVEIFHGLQCPYYIKSIGIKDGTYIRTGGTTRVAETFMVKELMLEGTNGSFDQLPAEGCDLSDEEIEALCVEMTSYAKKMCRSEEERAHVHTMSRNQLISWGLLIEKEGKLLPSNGFCLLAGKQIPFVSSTIQCAVFKNNNRAVFVDRKNYGGSLQNQIDKAYDFVLRSIAMGAKIEGLYRQDVYEFPIGTVREMICNAVAHRSFLEPSNVQVALYDNRLEVTSPGMLLGGVSLKKMKEGYSKIRNRGIANAFSYMKIMESWGSGVPRMFQECSDYGLEEPELIDFDGDFRINLYRKERRINQITTQSTQTPPNPPKPHLNPTQSTQTTTQLSELDSAIVKIILSNPMLTQVEIALELGWSINKVKYYTKKLSDKGIVEHVGTKRNGVWKVMLDVS